MADFLRPTVFHGVIRLSPSRLLLAVLSLCAVLPLGLLAVPFATSTLAGSPNEPGHADGPAANARFNAPRGLALDPSGNLYVADTLNHVIRKITPAGLVSTVAGAPGQSGFVDAAGAAARFFQPRALVADPAGNLVVSDANGVRRINTDGLVSTLVQTFGVAPGIALTSDGALIYTEPFYDNGTFRGHRLRRRDPTGASTDLIRTPVGSLNTFSRVDLAFAPDGTLYIADDHATAIQKLTPAGHLVIHAGTPGLPGTQDGAGLDARFTAIAGLTNDPAGNLYVTDAETTVRHITPEGVVTTVAGLPGTRGHVDGVTGIAQFQSLGDIVTARTDLSFWVADTGSHTIRRAVPAAVLSYPPTITTLPGAQSQNVAPGSAAAFTVHAVGPGLRYQWSRNGVPIPGATNATLSLSGVTAAQVGAYSVVVTTDAGSASLAAGMLNVHATTIPSFSVRHTRPGAGMLWSIASGNGLLVTVGEGGTILTSTDGRTWTRRASGTTDWLVAVTYGAGQFVAVGDRGRILLSPDGLAWTPALATNTTQRLNNVLHAANLFVAVGEAGTILTSSDARTWTPRDSGVTGWLRGLAFHPAPLARVYSTTFVHPSEPTTVRASPASFSITGQRGIILTSADGLTWQQSAVSSLDLEGLIATDSESNFVGIGQNGSALELPRFGYPNSRIMPTGTFYFFSPRNHPTGASVRLRGIARGASALFATGENGTILAAPGVSGPWTRIPSGTTANLVNGVFHGNSLYAVGAEETIVQSEPLAESRLRNISTRGQVATGADTLISGFVIQGSAPHQVLVRAVGPSLAAFGVPNPIPNPTLTLFDGAARPLANNTRWSTALNASDIAAASARSGAFPLAATSADSALLLTLNPGAYTTQIHGVDATGLGLIEVYDVSPAAASASRIINISTRGPVGAGAQRLIAGFVIDGPASRRVLIRAVGPTLASFGVSGALTQPELQLYNAQGVLFATAAAWSQSRESAEIRDAASVAGAFALPPDSLDAALVATLLPGAYTAQVSGRNGATGVALVEIYDLP